MFGKTFLRQDQETMIRQAEGLKHDPKLMLIDDADRPAKWYFGLKANLLEARRSGVEMVHPLEGPVTLRWRSGGDSLRVEEFKGLRVKKLKSKGARTDRLAAISS